MEHKFKIGDKVKSSSYAKGLIGEIIKVRAEDYTVDFGGEYNSGHDGDMGREYKDRCWFITEKTLELVSSGQNNKPYSNLIIHCPTESEYKRVCIKLGEEGYGTWTEGIALRWYEENGKMVIWKAPWKWYKEEYEKGDYKDHAFLTAKEFLGEEEEEKKVWFTSTPRGRFWHDLEPLTTKKKSMLQRLSDTLKRVLNKDMQAQYKAGYRNGDLELTDRGENALLNLLAIDKEKDLAVSALEYIKEKKEEEDE